MKGEIKVVSKRSLSPELGWVDVYVGRPSALGNPFAMKSESDRAQVIADYRVWLWKQIRQSSCLPAELKRIVWLAYCGKKVRLICWCAPSPCHADVIKACAEWMIPSKLTLAWLQGIGKKLGIEIEKLESPEPRNTYETRRGCYKGRYSVDGWICRNLEEVYAKIFNPTFDPTDFNNY